jgi:hypothetical protein
MSCSPGLFIDYHSYDRSFTSDVVKTFLFPKITHGDAYLGETMKPYCLHSETRGALFDILFKLANTQPKRTLIAAYISGLLENGIPLVRPTDMSRSRDISR